MNRMFDQMSLEAGLIVYGYEFKLRNMAIIL